VPVPPSSHSRAYFGSFELNIRTRELREGSNTTLLQEQPYKVLLLLLQQGNDVATRDDIKGRLWSDNTMVDFDRSINAAVKILRRALNDSPDEPRYIETLPRLGYRLLVPVSWISSTLPEKSTNDIDAHVNGSTLPSELKEPAGGEPFPGSSPIRGLRSRFALISALLVIVTALGAGVLYFRSHRTTAKLADKDTVVIADFANGTNDHVFDGTLKTALVVALNQSPFLNVLPDNRVAAILQLMELPASTALTATVARELCQRAGAHAYITGSIAALGSSYVIAVKAEDCRNGDLLGQQQVTSISKEKVLESLGDAAIHLRAQLGESLATVQKYDVPLEQATTSSLDALKEYSIGLDHGGKKGFASAVPHFKKAIELDPRFAMAYRALGMSYFAVAELGRASEYFTKAYDLREHASEREKLRILAEYYENVTGELDKAAEAYQELIESYPQESEVFLDENVGYASQGQYTKALEANREAQRLAPDTVPPYENVVISLLALQRFNEAQQVIDEAESRHLDDFLLHTELYALAFLRTDSHAMQEQQQWYSGRPEYQNLGLALASDTEAYSGRLARSETLTRQSLEAAARADSIESGAVWLENSALREAGFGKPKDAIQAAATGLKLVPASQGVELEAALAFAMAGDATRAKSLADDLNHRFPRDTQVQSLWLPAIFAQIALDRRDWRAATEHLQTGQPQVELGQIMFLNNISCLYPIYIRGQAYLAAGAGRTAADAFQRIVEHSGIVWNCWTGALAHLGIARASALEAKTSTGEEAEAARRRAFKEYEEFFALWKDADPDIPVLRQAKSEYTKLH
jgi:DNA-binding winged helix-turn-helix (wHTH) protein/tetratricopeptide (TPR) repeat protein